MVAKVYNVYPKQHCYLWTIIHSPKYTSHAKTSINLKKHNNLLIIIRLIGISLKYLQLWNQYKYFKMHIKMAREIT